MQDPDQTTNQNTNQFILVLDWSDSEQTQLITQAVEWIIENNIHVISLDEIGHHYTVKIITFTDTVSAALFKLRFGNLVVCEKFL